MPLLRPLDVKVNDSDRELLGLISPAAGEPQPQEDAVDKVEI
jgi:hypothetical protein